MPPTSDDRYYCPYLDAEVVLTAERSVHIALRHPEIAHGLGRRLANALADPDTIRRSRREPRALLFTRRYTEVGVSTNVVVVILRDAGSPSRNWIVTAYAARRLPSGGIVWTRS